MRLGVSTALVAILVVALVARVGVIVATPDFTPIFDAADFDRHAVSIADGHGFPPSKFASHGPSAFRPPLYPAALAVVRALGGGLTAERVFGALLGVATVLLIFLVAQRLWGRRVALVAGSIAAVFPPLVVLSASLLSELLFLPLVLAAVLAVLEYRDRGQLRWAIAAGVLCALAVLARVNGLPLVLALALGAWTLRPRFSRRALVAPAVVVLAMLVTLAPWVIRNTIEFGRFTGVSTGAGWALVGTYNAEARARGEHPGQPFAPNTLQSFRATLAERRFEEDELLGHLNDQAVDYMRDHPGYVVATIAWNVPRVLDLTRWQPFEDAFAAREVQATGVERIDSPVVFLGSLYAVLLLALVGAACRAGIRRSGPAPLFFWIAPVMLLLPALAIYGLPRYRAPVDPFLVILAAVGIVAAFDRRSRRSAPAGGDSAPGPKREEAAPEAASA